LSECTHVAAPEKGVLEPELYGEKSPLKKREPRTTFKKKY